MPTIDTRAGAIFYARRGTAGLPVIAIHGAGGTHRHWGYQMRDLADLAPFYALDLPGHGRSALPGRASVPEYGAAVLALLDACRLDRAVLAGHSMGGAIALWAALEQPERVAGLALVGSGARLRVAPAILQGLAEDYRATQQMIVRMSYAPGAPAELLAQADADYARCDPQVYRDDFVACDGFDLRGRLGELGLPATIVCGDADRMTPPKYSHELQAGIVGAALTLVGEAGHMALIERPAVVSAALRELLARCGA
jgi:pimeloyl-ACP methyl ester carboxylesterase